MVETRFLRFTIADGFFRTEARRFRGEYRDGQTPVCGALHTVRGCHIPHCCIVSDVLPILVPRRKRELESTRDLMGTNYWNYGVEANRKELESIMRYVFEQGLVERQIGFEEMFDASTLALEEDFGN